MARYKGRPSSKAFKREFPHIVEVAVSPRGLGTQLGITFGKVTDAMVAH
jgi:hypothetical protein